MRPDASRELTGTPEDFTAGCRRDMERARAEADAREGEPARATRARRSRAFDAAFAALGEAASRASLARNVHPDPRLRDAAEAAEQEVDALSTELSLDRGLYDALAALDVSGEDAATRHLVVKSLRDFRRAGVDRDEPTRARVRALREELVRIGQEFGRNIKDDVRQLELEPAELDGLPEDWRRSHPPGPDGKVDRHDRQHRLRAVHDVRAERAGARGALAALPAARPPAEPRRARADARAPRRARPRPRLPVLGGVRHRGQDDRLGGGGAPSSSRRSRAPRRRACAATTRSSSRASARTCPARERVEPWDSAYLQERIKAEQYDFDSQSVRPYFEYGAGEGRRARRHRAAVRHRLPPRRRAGVAPGRRGLRRRRGRARSSGASTSTCTRARASTSTTPSSRSRPGQRGRAAPRGRPRLQLPAPGAGRARAHGARRREDLLPRVRPPPAPRPRRPHPLGGAVRRRDRVGLRRGAVADARGVGLGSRRCSRASRATSRPASRSPPRSSGA